MQVVAVDPRGPTSGTLQEGDVIVDDRRPTPRPATVESLREFEKRLQGGGRGQLIIVRDGEAFAVEFLSAPPAALREPLTRGASESAS